MATEVMNRRNEDSQPRISLEEVHHSITHSETIAAPDELFSLLETSWDIDDHADRKCASLQQLAQLLARYEAAFHMLGEQTGFRWPAMTELSTWIAQYTADSERIISDYERGEGITMGTIKPPFREGYPIWTARNESSIFSPLNALSYRGVYKVNGIPSPISYLKQILYFYLLLIQSNQRVKEILRSTFTKLSSPSLRGMIFGESVDMGANNFDSFCEGMQRRIFAIALAFAQNEVITQFTNAAQLEIRGGKHDGLQGSFRHPEDKDAALHSGRFWEETLEADRAGDFSRNIAETLKIPGGVVFKVDENRLRHFCDDSQQIFATDPGIPFGGRTSRHQGCNSHRTRYYSGSVYNQRELSGMPVMGPRSDLGNAKISISIPEESRLMNWKRFVDESSS